VGLLSWLGGDRRSAAPTDGAAPAVGPADAGTPGPPGTDPGRPVIGGWRELPPVQRTTQDLGLVTDPGGFRASLDTWQDVSLSGPLGHVVSPDAPAGLLYGVASPYSGPADPPIPHEAAPPPRPEPPSAAGAAGPAVALQRIADAALLTSAAPTGGASTRHLTGGPAVVERPVVPDAFSDASAAPAVPTLHDLPSPSPLPPPAPVQRALTPERAPVPVPPRSPHHLGVGEPLAGLPPTAQREPAARSVPAPAGPEHAGPAELPGSAPESAVASAPSEGPAPASGPLLADDPLVPVVDDAPLGPAPSAPSALSAPPVQDGPPRPPSPDALGGSRPLPVVGLQRLPAAGPSAPPGGGESRAAPERTAGLTGERPLPRYSAPDPAPAPDPGPPVVVARWAVAAGPGDPGRPPAPADPAPVTVRTAGAPAVQRTAPSDPGPGAPRPAAGPQPGGWPSEVGTGGGTGRRADAGSVAVAAGVAQRTADGSVVFGTPRPPLPAYPASPAVPAPAVQRATDPAPQAAPDPVPEPPSAPVAEPAATPPPAVAGSGPGGTAGPSPGGPAPHDGERPAAHVDDELVRALFPRLSRLIKAELRLDRERAGRLINTRH